MIYIFIYITYNEEICLYSWYNVEMATKRLVITHYWTFIHISSSCEHKHGKTSKKFSFKLVVS
jgi:hypothetical protein